MDGIASKYRWRARATSRLASAIAAAFASNAFDSASASLSCVLSTASSADSAANVTDPLSPLSHDFTRIHNEIGWEISPRRACSTGTGAALRTGVGTTAFLAGVDFASVDFADIDLTDVDF